MQGTPRRNGGVGEKTADCYVQELVLEPRFNKELKEKTKSTEQQIAHARECVMKRRD